VCPERYPARKAASTAARSCWATSGMLTGITGVSLRLAPSGPGKPLAFISCRLAAYSEFLTEMSPELTVILPTRNEAEVIRDVIGDVQNVLEGVVAYEILVVDDDSTDGTPEVVQALMSQSAGLRMINRLRCDGLAGALREGVRNAKGSVVVWMDADGSMGAQTIVAMLEAKRAGNDVVVGSRFVAGGAPKGGSRDSRVVSWISRYRLLRQSGENPGAALMGDMLNTVLNRLGDRRVTDYTSGFFLCDPATALKLGFRGRHGAYSIRFISHALRTGLILIEIPYAISLRSTGESKTNWRDVLFRTGWSYVAAGLCAVVCLRFMRYSKK